MNDIKIMKVLMAGLSFLSIFLLGLCIIGIRIKASNNIPNLIIKESAPTIIVSSGNSIECPAWVKLNDIKIPINLDITKRHLSVFPAISECAYISDNDHIWIYNSGH